MKLTMVALIGIGVAGMDMRPARACAPLQCPPPAFVPADQATVPANLPGIVWRPSRASTNPDPAQVTLVDAADPATPLAFTATAAQGWYVLVPDVPLVAGHHYTLVDATPCELDPTAPPTTATFAAATEAPLPTTLGWVSWTPDTKGEIDRAWACDVDQATGVYVDFGMELKPEAVPWWDVLLFTTWVDDQVWDEPGWMTQSEPAPGASWRGRGGDRVFAICAPRTGPNAYEFDDGMTPEDVHSLAMTATIAGTTLALVSEPTTVSLSCMDHVPVCDDEPMAPVPDGGGCAVGAGAGPLTLIALLGLRRRRR